MKRGLLYLSLILSLATGSAYANDPNMINRSSFTATNETAYLAAAYLDAVVVSSVSAAGVLTIYNSTFTTTAKVATISLGTVMEYDFKNLQVKGIYYVLSGNTQPGLTILYKK